MFECIFYLFDLKVNIWTISSLMTIATCGFHLGIIGNNITKNALNSQVVPSDLRTLCSISGLFTWTVLLKTHRWPPAMSTAPPPSPYSPWLWVRVWMQLPNAGLSGKLWSLYRMASKKPLHSFNKTYVSDFIHLAFAFSCMWQPLHIIYMYLVIVLVVESDVLIILIWAFPIKIWGGGPLLSVVTLHKYLVDC